MLGCWFVGFLGWCIVVGVICCFRCNVVVGFWLCVYGIGVMFVGCCDRFGVRLGYRLVRVIIVCYGVLVVRCCCFWNLVVLCVLVVLVCLFVGFGRIVWWLV